MMEATVTCESEYLTLRDGTRLAVSSWLDDHAQKGCLQRPAIVTTTRYWRSLSFKDDRPEYQSHQRAATYYCSKGYIFVSVDVRGTGASFGFRETEMSPVEVNDIGDIVAWVSQQHWCDGSVMTEGTSYTASTALYGLVTAHPALKVATCRAPDFDGYRHLLAPGGIVNQWFIGAWGETTAALDNNDVAALVAEGYMKPQNSTVSNLLGVRPVDNDHDGSLLAAAVAEHKANFNLKGHEASIDYIDNIIYEKHRVLFDPDYQEKIEQSDIPVVIRCGWHDAGTQLGALAMFVSFNTPMHVIIDPYNHGGNYRADPFDSDEYGKSAEVPWEDVWGATVNVLDELFSRDTDDNVPVSNIRRFERHEPALSSRPFRRVDYYTLGENRWKTTEVWPLPQTQMQRWYLRECHQLSQQLPTSKQGSDIYHVDSSASTGFDNRWFAQAPNKPILFPDRQDEDKKLLVYDTPPLAQDTEITGHPVVHLQFRSSATDGQFFAYLEAVDPDGRVRLLTEGQLRGLHRKVSNEKPPYTMFGPYHSLMKKDAQLIVPGEVFEIAFDLFPLSIMLKKGQRIRLAIAGADSDVFAPILGCENPELKLERNSTYTSFIDLPVVASC